MEYPGWFPDDPDDCLALAAAIVALHFGVITFVIAGEAVILFGGWRRWRWVRNRWFRVAHLGVILFVAVQALLGGVCPLTRWEYWLRLKGREPIEDADFIARWLHEAVFVDASPVTLTLCYASFAVLVLASIFLVPVRWRRRSGGTP